MTQKQKGLIGLVLMVVLAFATIFGSAPLYRAIDSAGKPAGNYTPGTYVGTGSGFAGDITATVTVDETSILSVELSGASKRELHDDYGMKPVSPIGKEWYEQADAMGAYVIGKTADEVTGIAVDEAGKPTDADLLTGVTITANGFRDAIVKAVENAK